MRKQANLFTRVLPVACVLAACVLTVGMQASRAAAQQPYKIQQRWTIGGEGGWDYLLADPHTSRIYLTHGTRVDVVAMKTGKVIGAVTGLVRCHGVVIAPDGRHGFISDGGASKVVIFDTADFKTVGSIPAGTNPDGMTSELSTKTLWAFNGTSKDATVIDMAAEKPIGTIALPGKPEFPVSDEHGTVFVNIEDKNEIVRLDVKSQKITATWPLAGCDSPSGLAFDAEGYRLFSVCDGKKMVVTDAHTGKLLASPAIGDGPDAAGYDPKTRLAFASNGGGTLSVVDAGKPDYPVIQTLETMKGARTMSLDAAADKVYLVTAKMGPAPAPTAAAPRPRPSIVPGSFMVLVVGR